MANIIIVDGIDRIGKTTLCKYLSRTTGIPIFKENRTFTGDAKIDVKAGLSSQLSQLNMIESLDADIIFDRFFASEFVYGTLERGCKKSDAINAVCETLEKMIELRNNGVNIIYVSFKPTDVVKSSKEHGKSLIEHAENFDMLDGVICNTYKQAIDTFIIANYDTLTEAYLSTIERIRF